MGYSVLSKYRSELMGAAMLWVMLFHAADLTFPIPGLDLFRAAGFGGVDIFILLSAMGLSLSLSRLEQEYGAFLARRARRILPAYFVVMVPYTLFLILRGPGPPLRPGVELHPPRLLGPCPWGLQLVCVRHPALLCPRPLVFPPAAPLQAPCAVDGRGRRPRRWLCATC